ncbi:MAG: GNAT family N-acetyltransferase [Acidobacteriota bacterium]
MRVLATLHQPVEDENAGRCLLRDGTVVTVRPTEPVDLSRMEAFFHALSPDSLYQRFFRAGTPSRTFVAPWCDPSQPQESFTLVATRRDAGGEQFVAVATYVRTVTGVAEVAFAVSDHYQGKGIGTALLERLVLVGAHNGFATFRASTLRANLAMQEVFRQSGFQIATSPDQDVVSIVLTLTPSATSTAAAEERERVAATASIRPFLEPRAIAVIGASRNEASIGRRVLDALVMAASSATLYPVNPTASDVAGITAYPNVTDIPGPVDLAVIAIPRDRVLGAVDACAAKGVTAVVVISAGFSEVDDTGRDLQRQLVEKVRGYGMRLVGPNCMGLVNTDPAFRVNASFSPVFPPAGGFALSSQSGAIGIVILALAKARQVGISSFVSVGNKADVSGNDLIQYWESDPRTKVIGLYLESFGNPRRFARIAKRVSRHKPIVVVKAGRTGAGLRAASSHTAALASREVAVDALLRQSGAIRVGTIDEMLDVAACLDAQPLPAGRRVAIVTNGGGPGILAADACETAGLEVVQLTDATRERLRTLVPGLAVPSNPLDMIASAGPDAYEHVVAALLESTEVDAVMVIYTPVDRVSADLVHGAIASGVARARRAGATSSPVVACLMAETGYALEAEGERIPVYAFPENAARALERAADYAAWRALPEEHIWSWDDADPDVARAVCANALTARGPDWLTPEETGIVLAAYDLHMTPGPLAKTAEEAVAVARVFGFPVVAKLRARGLVHKTDVGGVRAHLSSAEAVAAAFVELATTAQLHALTFEGVSVQAMSQGGVEVMVGVARDPTFGPLVGFGLGGVDVEIMGDAQFGLAPLTDRDVSNLIAHSRARRLLEGYRGRPPADREALADLLSRISALADAVPEIAEMDLNPVFVLEQGRGCELVDVRVRVAAS